MSFFLHGQSSNGQESLKRKTTDGTWNKKALMSRFFAVSPLGAKKVSGKNKTKMEKLFSIMGRENLANSVYEFSTDFF